MRTRLLPRSTAWGITPRRFPPELPEDPSQTEPGESAGCRKLPPVDCVGGLAYNRILRASVDLAFDYRHLGDQGVPRDERQSFRTEWACRVCS
jgi:hypothetical protein